MYVGIVIQIRLNLLLEELEGDLGHDALELPGRTLVEGFDRLMTLCLCLVFWAEVVFEDLLKERDPWSELAWLCQIWSYSNLLGDY